MNIALFAQSGIFRTLQGLVHVWTESRRRALHPATQATSVWHPIAPSSLAESALNSRAAGQNLSNLRPLRVIRVLEAGQDRSGGGRMVISGRMADVCAELDRLAAREAACS